MVVAYALGHLLGVVCVWALLTHHTPQLVGSVMLVAFVANFLTVAVLGWLATAGTVRLPTAIFFVLLNIGLTVGVIIVGNHVPLS